MEIAWIVGALAILSGALAWDAYSQRQHVARVLGAWSQERRAIAAGPVGVIAHDMDEGRILGALGAADGQLIFTGQRDAGADFAVPLAALRWIGLRTTAKVTWNRRIERRVLIVHFEDAQGWHVFMFSDGRVEPFARQLARAVSLPLQDTGEGREDFGPAQAIPLTQGASGAWMPDPDTARRDEAALFQDLYLAPDCLVIGWRETIRLDAILRVDMIPKGKGNPFHENLLRLEIDNMPGTIGFLVENAGDWAGVLEHRTDALVTHHGR